MSYLAFHSAFAQVSWAQPLGTVTLRVILYCTYVKTCRQYSTFMLPRCSSELCFLPEVAVWLFHQMNQMSPHMHLQDLSSPGNLTPVIINTKLILLYETNLNYLYIGNTLSWATVCGAVELHYSERCFSFLAYLHWHTVSGPDHIIETLVCVMQQNSPAPHTAAPPSNMIIKLNRHHESKQF